MPMGDTEWVSESNQLVIRSKHNTRDTARLSPIDAQTLGSSTSMEAFGCTATETLTLVIDNLNQRWAQGFYSARMSHDGSKSCIALAAEEGLPDSCETIVHWQAKRSSLY